MRILISNDDGIHARGLAALERIAAQLTDDVWVVAPDAERSGASRALTLADPVRVRQAGAQRFSTTGTPTDCVMMGIHQLVVGKKPDLVLSGVNRGANLAEDVTMSGTVAAAIEAMALGVPAIALSQTSTFRPDEDPTTFFDPAETFGPGIIRRLMEIGWPKDVVMNVNFPRAAVDRITTVEVTRQGFRDSHIRHAEKRTDLRGVDYYWMGFQSVEHNAAEGTDLRAIAQGRISVTPLHIDLTHNATLHDLKKVLGGAPPKA